MRKRSKRAIDRRAARGFDELAPRLLRPPDCFLPDAIHLVEPRCDRGEQQVVVERLHEIVVGARLLAHEEVVPLPERGDEDEWHVGQAALLAHGPEHAVAAQSRHGDVAEHEIGPLALQQLDGLYAVRRLACV